MWTQDVRFILCHVDCDWYTSHKQVLEFLTERLVPGAVLLFDDPFLVGARRAIEEWVSAIGPRANYDGEFKLTWM
jgi:hypothetical protein